MDWNGRVCDYRTMAGDFEWRDVGERVHEARLSAGLSQADLAARLDLDRTMIAKAEAGKRRLDALELVKLSAALDLPIEHFLSRSPAVISRRRAPVHEDTTSGATRDSHRLEAALEGWLRDVRQIVELGSMPIVPQLRYPGLVESDDDARKAALWLREELGLGLRPVETLMDICERAGQLVLLTDLSGDGASLVDGDLAVAVVSTSGDPGRRRATGAHELGHLVVGDEYSNDLGVSASRQEREEVIDRFAAELLLPTEVVASACADTDMDRRLLVALAARYRTSWTLAVKQAQRATDIGREEVRALRSSRPTRAEFMDAVGWAPLPDLESVRVPPSYARGVMDAWRKGLVTSARAIELMHGQISSEDLPERDNGDLGA